MERDELKILPSRFFPTQLSNSAYKLTFEVVIENLQALIYDLSNQERDNKMKSNHSNTWRIGKYDFERIRHMDLQFFHFRRVSFRFILIKIYFWTSFWVQSTVRIIREFNAGCRSYRPYTMDHTSWCFGHVFWLVEWTYAVKSSRAPCYP